MINTSILRIKTLTPVHIQGKEADLVFNFHIFGKDGLVKEVDSASLYNIDYDKLKYVFNHLSNGNYDVAANFLKNDNRINYLSKRPLYYEGEINTKNVYLLPRIKDKFYVPGSSIKGVLKPELTNKGKDFFRVEDSKLMEDSFFGKSIILSKGKEEIKDMSLFLEAIIPGTEIEFKISFYTNYAKNLLINNLKKISKHHKKLLEYDLEFYRTWDKEFYNKEVNQIIRLLEKIKEEENILFIGGKKGQILDEVFFNKVKPFLKGKEKKFVKARSDKSSRNLIYYNGQYMPFGIVKYELLD